MTELSKNKLKWIRSLQQKKVREELGLFIVEGEKMVAELLATNASSIELICVTKDFEMKEQNFDVFLADDKQLEQISSLKTPNKVLAVVRQFNYKLPSENEFCLALDGVQDPGNLGTILRIADWFGVEHILCSKDTVEVYNPKVVQASMGAIFRIKTHQVDLKEHLSNYKGKIYGALLEGENVYKTTLENEGILLMGNEGNGISQDLISLITDKISIPRFGKAESLNVAVATGILVSEFKRD